MQHAFATRKFGAPQLCDGDAFRAGAWHSAPPAFADDPLFGAAPIRLVVPNVPLSRMARSKAGGPCG